MIHPIKRKETSQIARYYEKEMASNFINVNEKPISQAEYKKILDKNFNKSKMFILDDSGIKGFIWFKIIDNEINLEEIFTIEKNKGYGTQMMHFLIDFAKKEKIKKINLDVHFNNKNAIDFFKELNFSERTIEMSLDLE